MLDLIGRFPADLDALGAADALGPRRGDGHAISPEDIRLFETGLYGAVATRRGCPSGSRSRTIRAEPGWWLESARRLDAAGYDGVWALGPLHGPGDQTVPVVEGWTILSMAAGATERITVGPFVANVMNRHPAVLARMAWTLQIASGGRLVLGIGIGGAPREHAAYGIDFPDAPERVARLEEAVAVISALWTGGPVTRDSPYYPLVDAHGVPDPGPRHRRSSSAARRRPAPGWPAGSATAGARSTTTSSGTCRCTSRRSRPPAAGARTSACFVGFQGDWLGDADVGETEWMPRARAPPGSAGTRPARTGRSSSPARPPTSMRSLRPRNVVIAT